MYLRPDADKKGQRMRKLQNEMEAFAYDCSEDYCPIAVLPQKSLIPLRRIFTIPKKNDETKPAHFRNTWCTVLTPDVGAVHLSEVSPES